VFLTAQTDLAGKRAIALNCFDKDANQRLGGWHASVDRLRRIDNACLRIDRQSNRNTGGALIGLATAAPLKTYSSSIALRTT